MLDGLRKTLTSVSAFNSKGASFFTPRDEKNDGFGNFDNRRKYYENLAELKSLGVGKGLQLESLVNFTGAGRNATIVSQYSVKDTATIKSDAGVADDRGLAYRYALQELNPFVLTGASLYADFKAGGSLEGQLDRFERSYSKEEPDSIRCLDGPATILTYLTPVAITFLAATATCGALGVIAAGPIGSEDTGKS